MFNTAHNARVALSVAIVLGVGFSLGGCAAEQAGDGGGTSQTDQGSSADSGDKAPADDAGAKGFVDEDGDVPDWVAAGFPIYPGSKAAASAKASGITIISFSVPKSDEQTIYAWFVDQYSQNGWSATNLDDAHHSFDATNTDGSTSAVNVTKATYVMSVSQG